MRAGLLNEFITVERPVVGRSTYGSNEWAWKTVSNTRARVEYSSGSRSDTNDEIVWGTSIKFTIRIYHNVDEHCRVKWHGDYYRIISIEHNRAEQSLRIMTQKIDD